MPSGLGRQPEAEEALLRASEHADAELRVAIAGFAEQVGINAPDDPAGR